MLGLKKGKVKLVSHNIKWKSTFNKERRLLEKSLGVLTLGIEHIGSTAISGIYAKPIIDIDVGVKSTLDFKKFTSLLEKLGYRKVRNKNAPHVHLVFAKGNKTKGTTHYLHLIKYKGAIWNHDLGFRDYLRKNKKVRQQYSQLKKKLVKKYSGDRMAYTKNKKDFIERISKLVNS